MRRYQAVLALVIALLILAALYAGLLYVDSDIDPGGGGVVVRVHPGATLSQIQRKLEKEEVLLHPGLFRWAAYLRGKERKIKVGEYLFRRGESVASVLDKLAEGLVEYRRIVVPEGLMAGEIASIFRREAQVDSAAFMAAAGDSSIIRELGYDIEFLEGYLFPDTYLVSWPFSAADIVRRMVRRFGHVYGHEIAGAAESVQMTRHQAVTLASIIQAEAAVKKEMPKISAVYHNRLNRGMKLEADPTVAYALGGVRRKLWYNDLKIDSPYNTYIHRGLPPGPICSPGKAALKAAVRPEEDFDALYFVADGTGGHTFSRTLREHNRAKYEIRSGGPRGGER